MTPIKFLMHLLTTLLLALLALLALWGCVAVLHQISYLL